MKYKCDKNMLCYLLSGIQKKEVEYLGRQVYRKSLLERMSSPEQLDKMIIIASPSFWLAILGGALIVAVALVWSIFGRLPIHLETAGVFMSEQNIVHYSAETTGIVSNIEVAVGDAVEVGDTLLVLHNDTAERTLKDLYARREAVAAVTLASNGDIATTDTLDLIHLKLQYNTTGQKLYRQQFEALSLAILDGLDKEIASYEHMLDKTNVRAQTAGVVTDIKVHAGTAVAEGSEVVTLRQPAGKQQVICYVPLSSGKKITPGMEVVICPTTINQQQYGNMHGEVVAVDDYVTSYSTMQNTLGSDALAQMFIQNGPVISVVCQLRTDDTTASGFWWSNPKGASLVIPEGTIVMADIITDEKAPITMLIPYLKDRVTNTVSSGTVQ